MFGIWDCIRNVVVETRRLIDHSAPHLSTHSNLQDIFTSSFQEKELVGRCESLNKTCEKNHRGAYSNCRQTHANCIKAIYNFLNKLYLHTNFTQILIAFASKETTTF